MPSTVLCWHMVFRWATFTNICQKNSTYDILKIFGGKIFFVGKPKFLDGKEFDFDLKSNVDFNEIITSLTFIPSLIKR